MAIRRLRIPPRAHLWRGGARGGRRVGHGEDGATNTATVEPGEGRMVGVVATVSGTIVRELPDRPLLWEPEKIGWWESVTGPRPLTRSRAAVVAGTLVVSLGISVVGLRALSAKIKADAGRAQVEATRAGAVDGSENPKGR